MTTTESDDDAPDFDTYDYAQAAEMRRELDKSVLTLSAGALALSVTFVKQIAGSGPTWTPLSAFAWSAFAAAVCATLWSRRASEEVWHARADVDFENDAGGDDPPTDAVRRFDDVRDKVRFWNGVAFAAFISGVVLFCAFAFINLSREATVVKAPAEEADERAAEEGDRPAARAASEEAEEVKR